VSLGATRLSDGYCKRCGDVNRSSTIPLGRKPLGEMRDRRAAWEPGGLMGEEEDARSQNADPRRHRAELGLFGSRPSHRVNRRTVGYIVVRAHTDPHI
jgi:hypothetical protein